MGGPAPPRDMRKAKYHSVGQKVTRPSRRCLKTVGIPVTCRCHGRQMSQATAVSAPNAPAHDQTLFHAHFLLTTMSEQQPLLSADPRSANEDAELGSGGAGPEKSRIARYKEHTAETLESRPWHYTVILLARIFPACLYALYIFCHGLCYSYAMHRSSPTPFVFLRISRTRCSRTPVHRSKAPRHLSGLTSCLAYLSP